ncbi:type II toxin-antitoxin system antitoxin SocA domain-containing protein [Methylorubrum podarium]|uniref:Type II toxin-antitoxin system antitoxin SocA domain-containing protein n=1 Tax=Methylorubrum podarium TaxID=200476 RepID=A0ABV1QMT8_9HYPH
MSAPTTAASVANTFLQLQDSDPGAFPRIDPLKLQKLLFYAQAWWLAYNHSELFDEEIYAWPWGPVVPSIYSQFRDFGAQPITNRRATVLNRTGEGMLDFEVEFPTPPPTNVQDFLRRLWDSHKHLSGIQLSNATHAPGEPWTVVKERYGDLANKPLIPTDLMRDIFRSKLASAR